MISKVPSVNPLNLQMLLLVYLLLIITAGRVFIFILLHFFSIIKWKKLIGYVFWWSYKSSSPSYASNL